MKDYIGQKEHYAQNLETYAQQLFLIVNRAYTIKRAIPVLLRIPISKYKQRNSLIISDNLSLSTETHYFCYMKQKPVKDSNYDFDASTYILVGCILLVILLGALKIVFF